MTDLRYKMIMALNAADLGDPLCEQAADICAEIADQHCVELHRAASPTVPREQPATVHHART